MKNIKLNEYWVGIYSIAEQSVEDFAVLFEFWKAGDATESETQEAYEKAQSLLDDAEFKATLNEPEDELPAVLQINSGAGGTESQDWAEMLARMYRMYGEKQGWKVTELDWVWGDGAGIKTCTLQFEGPFAYGFLKAESGVHRLVRISPFDSNARRHTSFSSVFVYPLVDDTIKTERSQLGNREKAMTMLKSRLYEEELRKRNELRDAVNSTKKKIEWGSQIRSYVFHPYKMIKDHRTDFEVGNVQPVMDGDLDGFIKAYLMSEKDNKQS